MEKAGFVILAATIVAVANGCTCADDPRPYVVIDSIWDEPNRRIHETPAPADSNVFFITTYDPDRDPFKDLDAAVRAAQAEGKRIILVVGGNWCLPCIEVARFWAETEAIRERLIRDFVVVKVYYGPFNRNERFLLQFPEILTFPHIFVLDTDGRTLLSLGDGMDSILFDEDLFPEYLDGWTAETEGHEK